MPGLTEEFSAVVRTEVGFEVGSKGYSLAADCMWTRPRANAEVQ